MSLGLRVGETLDILERENTERSSGFRVRVRYTSYLSFPLFGVLGVLVHTIAHKHLVFHLPLGAEVLKSVF